ncbi:MAG: hypothetical protein OHK0053_35280 [Microscillaceae bacterium]
MANLREKFNQFKEKLGDMVADLSTIEVATFTGKLEISGQKLLKANERGFNTKAVFEEIKSQVEGEATLKFKLVAYTHIDFDTDSVNFVKEDLSNEVKALIEAHRVMVEAAQNARRSVLNIIKEVLD